MSSLNAVVNSLVRAAAAIPNEISDEDLDRHVAKLLADEAKAKEKSWNELGLGAYLGRSEPEAPDPNAPKPNKRFLAAVIRNVDGHNASVLRAQAQGVRDARDERRALSGSPRTGDRGDERSRRADRPAGAASRLFGGALSGLGQNDRARERRRGDEGDRRARWSRSEERSEPRRGSARDRLDDAQQTHRRERREQKRERPGDDDDRDYRNDRDLRRRERERERDRDIRNAGRSTSRSPRLSADDMPRAGPSRLRGWSDEESIKDLPSDKEARPRRLEAEEDRHDRRFDTAHGESNERRHRGSEPSRSRDRLPEREADTDRRRRDDSADRSKPKRRDEAPKSRRSRRDDDSPRRSSKRSSRSPDERSSRKERESRYDIDAKADDGRHVGNAAVPKSGRQYQDFDDPLRPAKSTTQRRRLSPSPSPLPPPPPPDEPPPPEPDFSPPRPQKLSKMDRYFESSYDPRLDVGEVPKDGPVLAVGWDNMLAVMKERGSKRRKHSPDLFDEHDRGHRTSKTARGGSPDDLDTRNFEDFERKRKKEKKKKLGLLDEEDEEERQRRKERKKREAEAEAMGLDAKGVMGIKYMPRGGMREWDMGKET